MTHHNYSGSVKPAYLVAMLFVGIVLGHEYGRAMIGGVGQRVEACLDDPLVEARCQG